MTTPRGRYVNLQITSSPEVTHSMAISLSAGLCRHPLLHFSSSQSVISLFLSLSGYHPRLIFFLFHREQPANIHVQSSSPRELEFASPNFVSLSLFPSFDNFSLFRKHPGAEITKGESGDAGNWYFLKKILKDLIDFYHLGELR